MHVVVLQALNGGVVQIVVGVVFVADNLEFRQFHPVAGVADVRCDLDDFRTLNSVHLEAEVLVGVGVAGEPMVGGRLSLCGQTIVVVGHAGELCPLCVIRVFLTQQPPRLRAAVGMVFRIAGGAQTVAFGYDRLSGVELDELRDEEVGVILCQPVGVLVGQFIQVWNNDVVHKVLVGVSPRGVASVCGGVVALGVEEGVVLSVVADGSVSCGFLPIPCECAERDDE